MHTTSQKYENIFNKLADPEALYSTRHAAI